MKSKITELKGWKKAFEAELLENILPYWQRLRTDDRFIPALDDQNKPIEGARLGLVMVTRLMWTYSRAYSMYGKKEYAKMALHAKTVLIKEFFDQRHGGFYWQLDEAGRVVDDQKYCYGQAFAIYAFSEFAAAFGNGESFNVAMELYRRLEESCWESENGGYLECFESDWKPSKRMQLGRRDLNAPKTMNNHLHMIEAYSNLLRVSNDGDVKTSCKRLLRTIFDRIVIPGEDRLGLYYSNDWKLLDEVVSPGHDIEASWLVLEAAEIVGDVDLNKEAHHVSLAMAERVSANGLSDEGAVLDEFHAENESPRTKTWWPIAEGIVGFFNAYQICEDESHLLRSKRLWDIVNSDLVDRENGEWFWGVDENGESRNFEKAGPWKSSYHNGRACMEMITRIETLISA